MTLLKNRDFSHFSLKWDGAPSVFVGRCPRDGQLFVAKKSIFNKTPILYKNYEEIYAHISNPELRKKMSWLLTYFNKFEIDGVIQGDIMFSSREEIGFAEYDFSEHLMIHANLICYSIPFASILAREIMFAECMGFAPHTMYDIDENYQLTMKPLEPLEFPKGVVVFGNRINTFPRDASTEIYLDPLEDWSHEFDTAYFNSFVRDGKPFPMSTPFETLYSNISKIKDIMLGNVLDDMIDLIDVRPVFITQEKKIIDTRHEGLVYNDGTDVIKLVNRHEFSAANFGDKFLKGFQR